MGYNVACDCTGKDKVGVKMIGREHERAILEQAARSDQSEFVAVYGRRRVGKTYLVRETFNSHFTFQHSGVANSNTRIQLDRFRRSLIESGHVKCPLLRNWFQAFDELKTVVESVHSGRKVLFIDEMPWMDKPNANFVPALENFWNAWASARKDILLIICGSATSWMLKKVIRARGGLHNRVTVRINLMPFTLAECEKMAMSLGLAISRYHVLQYYMALGGVPFYWNFLQRGLSVAQNMDALFFAEDARLEGEFHELYSSLFSKEAPYIQIVTALGRKKMGMSREEMAQATQMANSGTMTAYLDELEQCGLIRKYRIPRRKSRESIYQLIDNYTLFYFKFIRENVEQDPHFWTSSVDSRRLTSWQGLAFELLCLQHVSCIKHALQIGGVHSSVYTWQKTASEDSAGAQIDLLIDRDDGIINLCEMKFAAEPYLLTANDDRAMQSKRSALAEVFPRRKALHVTYVTTFGLVHNSYWNNVQSEVTLDDLFQEVTGV